MNKELINATTTHGVKHTIETEGRPLFAKARRLDPVKLRTAEQEFRKLEKAGIIQCSDSPWASPLHMVPKKDGTFRACGDYRRLNNATQADRYPLPNIYDFSTTLDGCTVFSKIDLVKGYHQVPMEKADIPKTVNITPFGLFEYLKMPFGLKNAAQTFQRMMDRIFKGLPYCFVYLDDILVASVNRKIHFRHLRSIFELLDQHGLVINPEKCIFGKSEIEYLGHTVSAAGIVPVRRQVQALQDFPPPTEVKQLQRFLGLINFYRRFLPSIARIMKPLTDALAGKPTKLQWSENMDKAFNDAKRCLLSAVSLAHPSPSAKISLAVDASATHVGAVLQQMDRGRC